VRERLAEFIVGEGNWLPLAMGVAFFAAGVLAISLKDSPDACLPRRDRILALMHAFTGMMLLILGFGHLLAVTTKLLQGTLRGSALLFYVIGIAVVVPAALILRQIGAIVTGRRHARSTEILNAWMAVTLVVLGLVNLPLAVPALCTIAYNRHQRDWAGWLILAVAAVACVGLLVGGLIFMASGQTFEEFSR
jgi:hypothetical protein